LAKNIANLRFSVRNIDGYTSNVWRLWSTKHGDVYVTTTSQAGIHKYSFHQSGICRSAFTAEHGTPKNMTDRLIHKWVRTPTPLKESNKYSRLAWIAIPTNFLSQRIDNTRKKISWVDAAPINNAVYIELVITSDSEENIKNKMHENNKILLFSPLVNGDSLLVFYYYGEWDNKELNSPPAKDSIFPELLFSENDPNNTGRPIRILMATQPCDNEAICIQELGGYKANA
jgi:hypothetical protein